MDPRAKLQRQELSRTLLALACCDVQNNDPVIDAIMQDIKIWARVADMRITAERGWPDDEQGNTHE